MGNRLAGNNRAYPNKPNAPNHPKLGIGIGLLSLL